MEDVRFAWAKPVPPPDITPHYGIGAGQIPGDWRADAPTVSGGLVNAVRNDGGAGAYFDMSNADGSGPTWDGAFIVPGGAAFTPLVFANPPNLAGVHLLAALDPNGVTGVGDLFSGTVKGNPRIGISQSAIVIGETGRLDYINTPYTPQPGLNLLEIRWDAAALSIVVGGGLVAQVAPPVISSFSPPALGQSRDGTTNVFNGRAGRFISVICDSGYSVGSPEPAVVAARALLRHQYRIAP